MVLHEGKKVSVSWEVGGRAWDDRAVTLSCHLCMKFPKTGAGRAVAEFLLSRSPPRTVTQARGGEVEQNPCLVVKL